MSDRLDLWLVEKGHFPSRGQAQAAVMAGRVLVNRKIVDKPGFRIRPGDMIEVKGEAFPFVSRGGLKLARALEFFQISVGGRICLDIGASTGGFTDCLLQNGAKKVYAVDVGYGQLAWALRSDPRVVALERTNARYLKPERFEERPNFCCIDVSFISLRIILPSVVPLLEPPAEIVALVKPQFEAGKERVGKKGVVRSAEVHVDVLKEVLAAGRELGLAAAGLTYSPVKGPEGNIEFLVYWGYGCADKEAAIDPGEVVAEAHRVL